MVASKYLSDIMEYYNYNIKKVQSFFNDISHKVCSDFITYGKKN